MLALRRGTVLVLILTVFVVILLLVQHASFQPARQKLLSASQLAAQRVGLGELDWTLSTPEDQTQALHNVTQQAFEYGKGKPADYNFTKVLVMPHTKKENVSWIYEQLPHIEKVVYVADDFTAPLHPPANKGHEVMVYLTYIIDNYETLPDVMIFMHAHRWAWHNSDLLGFDAKEMVNRLNPHRVAREGYMNLRCNWFPGCPNWMKPGETKHNPYKAEQKLLATAWNEIFPFEPLPKVLAQPCCSQFALSRDLVYTIPKTKFEAWRKWLLTTRLKDNMSGRVWEYMWQFAFTGKTTLCPSEHKCHCDGYGVCFGSKPEYELYFAIRTERDKFHKELLAWDRANRKILDAIEAGELTDDLDEPVAGQDQILNARIAALNDQLRTKMTIALERGMDPKLVAAELAGL